MKKQTKADAAFITKIKSLSVITKHSNASKLSALAEQFGVPETKEAPDGTKMHLQFAAIAEVTRRCRCQPKPENHEESFPA